MKHIVLLASLLLITACTSSPKVAMQNENASLCESHKTDFQFFNDAFDKEHAEICSGSCIYTASMNKNSEMMEQIAGLYYLMNCDLNYGRL